MKNVVVILGVVVVASLVVMGVAWAQGEVQTLYPSYRLVNTDGELIFEGWLIEDDSKSCIQMSNGNFFCCCEAGCSVEIDGTLVPKDPTPTRGVNDPTPTPSSPTDTPVTPPTDTPVPPPSDTPEPKVKCNSGRGNDSEGDPDCDPGNSGGHNEGGD